MTPNPYAGPRSIGDKEHPGEKIYGRDREIADLTDLIIADRIVLMYSPSGAGKSSLLQAGVVPKLVEREFQVRPIVRVNAPPPPEVNFDRATGNRFTLSCLLSLDTEAKTRTPAELSRLTLLDYLGANCNGEVLIFDQFEEVLTVDPLDREEKLEFFAQLGEALRAKGRWAVLAMREDYLAGLDSYVNLLPTRLSNTYRLDLLKPAAAMAGIRGPAESMKVDFKLDAAEMLIENLCRVNVHADDGKVAERPGRFVEPVQLQVVCWRLWDKLPAGAKEIGKAQLSGVGSVDSALAGYYSDAVEKIAAKQGVAERDLRDWFDRSLITKQNTRGQVVQGGDDSAALRPALKPLVDTYLIRSDKRLGSIWYELAHDRLIAPVQTSNCEWRKNHLSPLQKQTEEWIAHGRSKEYLLAGSALSEAKTWAAQHPMRTEEKEFLADCEDEEKGEAERYKSRKYWWYLLATSILLACAAGLAYSYLHKSQQLEDDKAKLETEKTKLDQDVGALAKNLVVLGQRAKDIEKSSVEAKASADALLADAKRKEDQILAEAQTQKARLVAEYSGVRDRLMMEVMRGVPIEDMLDDPAAGNEVKALGPGWTPVKLGPEKLVFATVRDLGPGKGRLIGVGHDGVFEFQNREGANLFVRAALTWLKRDRPGPVVFVKGSDPKYLRSLPERIRAAGFTAVASQPPSSITKAQLDTASVVVVTHGLQLEPGDVEAIGAYVNRGGGLLATGYAWVWVKYEVHKGVDVFGPEGEAAADTYPVNKLMKQFDVRWPNSIARYPKPTRR